MNEQERGLVLYGGALSMFSGKVRIALREKGIAFTEETVPFSFQAGYNPKHPIVAEHNPKGQVPVLGFGGTFLYDSTAILEFLEEQFPERPLYPRSPIEKARCRQIELESDEVFFPNVSALIRARVYGEAMSDQARDAVLSKIDALYERLDARLSGRSYLLDTFTVGDIAYVMAIRFAGNLGAPFGPRFENVARWFKQCRERPSVQVEFANMAQAGARLMSQA
jgi:glutathione S-transferase